MTAHVFDDGDVVRGKVRQWGVESYGKAGKKRFFMEYVVDALVPDPTEPAAVELLDRPTIRTVFRYFTPASIGILKRDLEQFGYDVNGWGLRRISPNVPDSFNFKDKVALLKVKKEDYNGKEKENWSVFYKGRKITHVDQTEWLKDADEFDAMLNDDEPTPPDNPAPVGGY